MDIGFITLQDAANIALFIAPGYVAIWTYSAIYAKRDKSFSHLLIESVAISLPLVAIVNWAWQTITHQAPSSTDIFYVVSIFVFSFAISILFAKLRITKPIRPLMNWVGLGMPDEDFIRSRFTELKKTNSSVTVTLKSGEVFSGTPSKGSIFSVGAPREYYFSNLAWFNSDDNRWDEREGGLIINLDAVNYIELTN
jgi:hypothetical protein